MTAGVTGGLLGLSAATGVIIAIWASPPMRPIRLLDRVAPYLGETSRPSRLLASASTTSAPFVVARRLFGPALKEGVRAIDRLVGGSTSVRRRLAGLGTRLTLEDFRIEQVVWGAAGTTGGAVGLAAVGASCGRVDAVLVGAAAMVGAVAGVLARDAWLSRQLARRERVMVAELPMVADLLALALVAGEAPVDALARAARLTGGEVARDIDAILRSARSGTPLTRALSEVAAHTTLDPLARFLSGLAIAIERGTPLAEVVRSQAADVREMAKRALLDAGGKKEISMMIPVVFLILPVTVLFALYPGLLTLTSIAR